MSQNGTEKYISLTWKDKQGEQQLCMCVWVCVCVCVCVRWGKRWQWMNRQPDGAVRKEVFLSLVSWFLEWAVNGVRIVWILELAQAGGNLKFRGEKHGYHLAKPSQWVCYGWLWALGQLLILFKKAKSALQQYGCYQNCKFMCLMQNDAYQI